MAEERERVVLELAVEGEQEYGSKLDRAKRQYRDFTDYIGKLSKDLKAFGKETEALGRSLTTSVTLPIAAVVGGLAALAIQTAKTGNEIAKGAREAGFGAQAYQELQFALGQIAKVSDQEVTRALGTLTQRIGEAATGSKEAERALTALGFSAREITAGTIDSEEAFSRLVTAMKNAKSPAEAMALAGDLMGDRLGKKFAGAIRESGDQIDVLRQRFRDLGLGMSGEALAAAERFEDQMDELKRQLGAVGREIGSALLPIIQDQLIPFLQQSAIPALKSLAQMIANLVKLFGDLPKPIQIGTAGIVALMAAIGPALLILGKLITALGVVVGAFAKKGAAMRAVTGLFPAYTAGATGAATATNALVGALGRIALPLAAIGTGFLIAKRDMDKYIQGMQNLIDKEQDWQKVRQNWREGKVDPGLVARTARPGQEGFFLGSDLGLGMVDPTAVQDVDELTKAVKKLADEIVGKHLAEKQRELAEAIASIGGAARVHVTQVSPILRQLDDWKTSGAQLLPVLERLRGELSFRMLPEGLSADRAGLGAMVQSFVKDIQVAQGTLTQVALEVGESFENAVAGMRLRQELDDAVAEAERLAHVLAGIPRQSQITFDLALTGKQQFQDALFSVLNAIGTRLPDVILAALQGGGNVGKSVGGLIGGEIGKALEGPAGDRIGKALWNTFGSMSKDMSSKIGRLVGSFLPGIGTLLGSVAGDLMGKGIQALAGAFDRNKGRDLVKDFATSLGGFDALQRQLQTLGDEGGRLWIRLTQGVGRNDPAAARRAIEEVTEAFRRHQEVQSEVQSGIASLLGATEVFGHRAPRAVRPLVEEILRLNGLTAEQRMLFEDLLKPTGWREVEAVLESIGSSAERMGESLSKAKQLDFALDLGRKLELLEDAGADVDGVLFDIREKLSGLVTDALASGLTLPETLRPFIERALELGLLLGPDGEIRTGIDGVDFAEIPDEPLLVLKDILEEIRDLLKTGLPAAARAAGQSLEAELSREFRPRVGLPFGSSRDSVPSFHAGTQGMYLPRDTPAYMHAGEAVTPRRDVPDLARDIASVLATVQGKGGGEFVAAPIYLDGRVVAEAVIRRIERNDGGGAPVGPLPRLQQALGVR